MMFWIQVLIYLLFFTVAIVVVAKGPVGGLFFYPKPVQQRVLELGLTDEAIIRKCKTWFFTVLVVGIAALPILFIGLWNRVTDFRTAYVQALFLLEIMNCTTALSSTGCGWGTASFGSSRGPKICPIVNVSEKEYISGYLKGGYRKDWFTKLAERFMRVNHMSFMLHVEFQEVQRK
jgi:hypothetical protein